jgi:Protein of unknown function (DUF4230)
MKFINNIVLYIAVAAVCLLVGIYWGGHLFTPSIKQEENSSIVVEKIEKVAKLITVEAHLSEIYSYKDYYNYDWSFLRKKALLRINAKVSAGYDIKKLNVKVDGKQKKIFIGPIPPIEILSIDHTLDYFDVEEGIFNGFTPEDYNHINANAKEFIKKVASNNEVLKQASAQQNTMIEMMQALAISMGYQLEVVKNEVNKIQY